MPDEALLAALQNGQITAIRDGQEIPRSHWFGRDSGSLIGNLRFWREEVLKLWPCDTHSSAGGSVAVAELAGREADLDPQEAEAAAVPLAARAEAGVPPVETGNREDEVNAAEPGELSEAPRSLGRPTLELCATVPFQPGLRRRGAYKAALEEWMAGKPLETLHRMKSYAIASCFKLYCEEQRPDLLSLLPKRLRSMRSLIERIVDDRMAAAKADRAKARAANGP
jgi:hypothetical protein